MILHRVANYSFNEILKLHNHNLNQNPIVNLVLKSSLKWRNWHIHF